MDLRFHETDPKLTVATYEDEAEAQKVLDEVLPDSFRQRALLYLGLTDVGDVSKDPSFTRLDDGRVEMTHRTTRLAQFAGRITRESASRLDNQPKEVFSGYKDRQVLGDTINQYIADRAAAIPARPEYAPKELTPREKARNEAFNRIKQPFGKTLLASVYAIGGAAIVAVSGRFVEVFSTNPNVPDHVNETVRQIGNDMSYGGVAVIGLGLATGFGIFRGQERNAQGFNAGWAAVENRLDPNGLIEASIPTEEPSIQATAQND